MHTRATGRRNSSIAELQSVISQVKERRISTALIEAKAEARKLMGIPDLQSNEYVRRYRTYFTNLNLLVRKVSELIATIRTGNVTIISMVDKKQLSDINTRIAALNEYRIQNPLLFAKMPELATLSIKELESNENFFYLVPVKSCGYGECPKRHAKKLEVPLSREAQRATKELVVPTKEKVYYCDSDKCPCGLPKSWLEGLP